MKREHFLTVHFITICFSSIEHIFLWDEMWLAARVRLSLLPEIEKKKKLKLNKQVSLIHLWIKWDPVCSRRLTANILKN